MNPFQILDAALIASPLGESIQYSRPAIGNNAPFGVMTIRAIVDTAGEYSSPTGPVFAAVLIQTALIPGGVQKGDLVVIANPTALLPAGTYQAQELFPDRTPGTTKLLVRWTGK